MKVNILSPEDVKEKLISFFKNNSIVPIVGSGFSCGLKAYDGIVPDGYNYKKHMVNELSAKNFSEKEKEEISSASFSIICDYYEDDENVSSEIRRNYLKSNFYKVKMPQSDIRSLLFNIEWPYIYTLNIDDAIENSSSYRKIILPNKGINEEVFSDEKCVIKLHGDIGDIVTYKESGKIFTSKEYAISIYTNAGILNKLRHDYKTQNVLFIGCSLDDEIDLKTLSAWPFDYQDKDTLSCTMAFIKGEPTKLQKSKLKIYGITDIVCFDSYESMYIFLDEAWNEAKKIQTTEIDMYNNIKINNISGGEIQKNQQYFLWNKMLYDVKRDTITYPYYFIKRKVAKKILANIDKNKVHLVYGPRVSGKSYLIADLYKTIRDREVYYFDGRSRITQNALENLMQKRNIVILFDVGTLERNQFEFILQDARHINKNCNNIIIMVNNNDSDTFGIVKWKLQKQIIDSSDIIQYKLKNKFEKDNEIQTINKLYPIVSLPPINDQRNMLDQLIFGEQILQKKGKYSNKKIKVETSKELALLILLAIKEKLYSLDIVNYGLDYEIAMGLKYYEPFIERIESNKYEKDASDLSGIKYVLSSPYWLRRELGNYARNEGNHHRIGEAYKYIIKKVIEFSGHNEYKRRRECRNLILFDKMNDIFLDEYHGNLKLIVYVYTELQELLANDFHFLHQKAKCFLNYSYYVSERDPRKSLDYLKDALELSTISKTMIENLYETTSNERLQISLAHTQYTRATIMCGICVSNNYIDVEDTIDAIEIAMLSPYNGEEYQHDRAKRTSYSIHNFLKYCMQHYDLMNISLESSRKLNELINKTFSKL